MCGGQRKILSCRLSFYLVVLGMELRPSVWTAGTPAGSSAPTESCHWPLYSRRVYGSRLSANIVPKVWCKESRCMESRILRSRMMLLSSLSNINSTPTDSMNKPKNSHYLGSSQNKEERAKQLPFVMGFAQNVVQHLRFDPSPRVFLRHL